MGFIGGLFGSKSGNTGGAGINYQATGPTQNQVNDAWSNTQSGLSHQQAFINALNAQNGIGNQSNVFGQQQDLANQLQMNAMGAGPNPAQAQFQQNANQVAAQTAGLIGSQKGMSPALQARLIAQQGAGAGQAAAGQAATLQAQQQLAAQQNLMQQQANMANLSTQQVGQQQNALNAYNQGAGNQYASTLGLQGNANSANAGVSGVVAGQQGKMFGGLLNGLGSAMAMSQGGAVPGYDMGGVVAPASPYSPTGPGNGPQSTVGKSLAGMGNAMSADPKDPLEEGSAKFSQGLFSMLKGKGNGQEAPMAGGAGDVAPGLGFGAAPVMAAANGGMIEGEKYSHKMKPVPGKPKVSGDSTSNDTVNAKLSPGEIIIPRSIATHPNAPEMAARFVAAVRAKQGRGIG